jgi:superfamily II DNA or RNA helicase
MYGRMLCSVLRTFREREDWCEKYPFEGIQATAIESLWEAIEMECEEEARMEAMIEAIHRLSVALICDEREISVDEDDFIFPLYRFLVIASVSEGGSFRQVGEITQVIAKLQWCVRATVFHEFMRRCKIDRTATVQGELCPFVQEGRNTGFNSIRQAMHLAASISQTTVTPPQLTWIGNDGMAVCIRGKVVTLQGIRDMVKERIEAAQEMLCKDVLYGLPLDNFGWTSAEIEDDLSDITPGYSFIDSPENGFKGHRWDLLHSICAHPETRVMMVERIEDGSILWRVAGCETWLKRSRAFLELLSSIIHITYGQPARGEELATIRIRNDAFGMRGIYWVNGRVMLFNSYSKNRSNTGLDRPVPRFLPESVGKLLIKYLTMVRPMEIFLSGKMEKSEENSLGMLLFADYRKAWTGERLSDVFKTETNLHGSAALGFREWRQVATGFMKYHLKHYDPNPDVGAIFDYQAGHSQTTAARSYAVGSKDHLKLTGDLVYAYSLASREWQGLLRVEEPTSESMGTESVGPTQSSCPNVNPIQSDELIAMMKKEVASSVAATMVTMTNDITEAIARMERPTTERVPLQTLPVNVARSIEGPKRQEGVSAKAMAGLRAFQNDENARFKSPEQAKAVQQVIDRKSDLLVILPTGGGKTLLYLMPATMEQGKTTVVILPLIAVLQDLRNRCIKAKISVAGWSRTSSWARATSVLLVAVEQAVSPAFHDYLQSLHDSDRLSRIVFDECHTCLTQNNFRHCMHDLVDRWQVDVPLLLLTATLPPFMESSLRGAVGCRKGLEVIRALTSRAEIRYRVIELEDDRSEEDMVFDISSITRALIDNLNSGGRGIVYCLSKQWAKDIRDRINSDAGEYVAEIYHAGQSAEEREWIYGNWKKGRWKVLIATSALGMGVDYGEVRFVIHHGGSRSLIDFSQESGRAGRDGKRAESIVVTSKRFRQSCEWMSEEHPEEWQAMKEWIEGENCRRWALGEYTDGKGKGIVCLAGEKCILCDVCERGRNDEGDGNGWVPPEVGMSVRMNVSQAKDDGRERIEIAMRVKGLLDELRDGCGVCWWHGDKADHELKRCRYVFGHCLRCLDRKHSLRECGPKVKYPKNVVCFTCGFPNKLGGEHVHGEISTGSCEPGLEDKVVPICWSAWHDRDSRKRLEREFEREWESADEYRVWLGLVTSKGVTNAVRVLLWAWSEREH